MWHDTDRTKPPYGKKILSQCHFAHQKIWHGQIWERTRGLRTERPSDNHLVNFNNGVQVNVIRKLNSCLTGNTICLEHTHEHTLMRYETTAFVLWILNALLGGKRNRSFSPKASGTHTTLPCCTQLITTLRYSLGMSDGFHVMPTYRLAATSTYGVAHPSGGRKRKRWPPVEPTWREACRWGQREEKGIYWEICQTV